MRALWRFEVILFCATSGFGPCRGEALKGVVFSDHSGEGPHRVGTIQLAVGNTVHELTYAEPLPRRFGSEACWDIGALWSVVYQVLPGGSRDISRVSCTGQVDENAHGPWLVARDYLQLAGSHSTSSSSMASSRWRSSPEFQKYEEKITALDISAYLLHGRPGRCIEVVNVGRDRAQLRAGSDCYLSLAKEPIYLYFSVLRNTKNGRWEIDEIKVE
jgi:hypothetical protein